VVAASVRSTKVRAGVDQDLQLLVGAGGVALRCGELAD
jgi:hypothetical protein